MPQRIEVPGMGIVEFPDGMTDAQIAEAIQANAPETGAQKLAKETGIGEAMMVAAGRKTDSILDGIVQMYLKATGDTKALSGLATNVADKESAYGPLRTARPFATGVGESLTALAVPGGASSYAGAAAAGALPELLSYGTLQDRASKGAVGAAGGMAGRAIGGAMTNVLKPAGVGVNANQAAVDAAKRIGFKPMAGQATQNPAMLNVENYLARNPGSSGIMQGIERGNRDAISRAAASAIGEKSDEVSAGLLKAAETRIGGEFDRLQSITAPVLGNDFVNSLVKIEAQNAARGPFRDSAIDTLLDKGMELAAKGNLSGKAYKEIRTELSNQATKAFKSGDATLGQAVKGVREALDTAAENSLSATEREAWKVAREQWGSWKTLTKGLVAEGGDVSAARVAQALRSQGPGFRTGSTTGPLTDVARIGEGFKGALNPNSGNLTNMMMYGNPITGVPLAVGNFAVAKTYTNPIVQAYLRNGILDIGKNGELIVRATGLPLGAAATKGLLGVE